MKHKNYHLRLLLKHQRMSIVNVLPVPEIFNMLLRFSFFLALHLFLISILGDNMKGGKSMR